MPHHNEQCHIRRVHRHERNDQCHHFILEQMVHKEVHTGSKDEVIDQPRSGSAFIEKNKRNGGLHNAFPQRYGEIVHSGDRIRHTCKTRHAAKNVRVPERNNSFRLRDGSKCIPAVSGNRINRLIGFIIKYQGMEEDENAHIDACKGCCMLVF